MQAEAKLIWTSLEFRSPELLRLVEPLSAEQMVWVPSTRSNSVSWLLWHIAEVEDNWVRNLVLGEEKRYPFGCSVRDADPQQHPEKTGLLGYLHDVRATTRQRLEVTGDAELGREVNDPHFGVISVREVWSGVITSFAWHAGQIALMCRLMGESAAAALDARIPAGGDS